MDDEISCQKTDEGDESENAVKEHAGGSGVSIAAAAAQLSRQILHEDDSNHSDSSDNIKDDNRANLHSAVREQALSFDEKEGYTEFDIRWSAANSPGAAGADERRLNRSSTTDASKWWKGDHDDNSNDQDDEQSAEEGDPSILLDSLSAQTYSRFLPLNANPTQHKNWYQKRLKLKSKLWGGKSKLRCSFSKKGTRSSTVGGANEDANDVSSLAFSVVSSFQTGVAKLAGGRRDQFAGTKKARNASGRSLMSRGTANTRSSWLSFRTTSSQTTKRTDGTQGANDNPWWSRPWGVCLVLCFIIVVVIGIPLLVQWFHSKELLGKVTRPPIRPKDLDQLMGNPDDHDAYASVLRAQELKARMTKIILERGISTPQQLKLATSPQHLAMDWVVGQSNNNNQSKNDDWWLQRYALAVLYYSWNKINAANALSSSWTHSDNWMDPNTSVCEWYGLECSRPSTELVTNLNLTDIQLQQGMLNLVELQVLTNLETLDVSRNSLWGPLPTSLAALTLLTSIKINDNYLSGSLPAEWSSLSRLINLDVANNQLQGSIPEEWEKAKFRKHLAAFNMDGNPNLIGGTLRSSSLSKPLRGAE